MNSSTDGLRRAGLLVADAKLRVVSAEGDIYRDPAVGPLVGRPLADVVPQASWKVLRPHYLAALKGEAQSLEHLAVAEGTTHEIRMMPVREGAEVVRVAVFSRDISRRTVEGRALAAVEPRHSAVLEALEEGVLVTDLERRLLDANAAARSILDLDVEAARTDPSWWGSISARLSGDGVVAEEVLATGRPQRDVHRQLDRLDGTQVSLSMNCLPWRHPSGEIGGIVLSFRDVTSSVVERRRLIEAESHLRHAHEVARLASWQWDPHTDSVSVFHALTGEASHSGEVLPLEGLLAALPAAAREVAREDLAALVRGERDESCRRLCEELDGGPTWMELRARAVRDADGNLICVRGTSQDVTEQELGARSIASARDFFQATLDSLRACVAVLDESGQILETNRAWDRAGPGEGAALGGAGDNYFSLCAAPESQPLGADVVAGLRAIASRESEESSLEYLSGGRWFLLRGARYEGPGPARIVISSNEVTDLHRAQARSETQSALLDEVDVAVVATDPERRVTHWNRAAERLFGWTADEAVGRLTSSLIVLADDTNPDEVIADLGREGRWEGELLVHRKDGTTFPAYVRNRVILGDEGQVTGTIGVAVDLTERIASELDLRSARDYLRAVADSMGDGLCTLDNEGRVVYVNPRAEALLGWTTAELSGKDFHEALHHTRPDGSPYPADECALVAARRARSPARVDDEVLVGRTGSWLPVQLVQTPFETEDGVGGFVVVISDIAERKRQEHDEERKLHDVAWIERIRDALDNDRLVLFAQPIIEIAGQRAVQHELLLRMIGDEGTVIAPGLFLPVAESYGWIGEIDRWVTRQTVAIAAQGHAVEMNVSAHSLSDPSFYDYVESELRRSGADPALLVFELTETALVRDQAATEDFALRIHGLGCKLALDDFGTGYGGFTYLKQLPIDFLKIDIEFVRDLATNPASRHVVQAVVALAQGFDLKTVAEGVEDARTLEMLREYGVDYAQGYHVGRPAVLQSVFA